MVTEGADKGPCTTDAYEEFLKSTPLEALLIPIQNQEIWARINACALKER